VESAKGYREERSEGRDRERKSRECILRSSRSGRNLKKLKKLEKKLKKF